ncbi:MAG: methyltransferase [Clostridia bacterium]|nr:methyltransferase [Clostridia bacterium]
MELRENERIDYVNDDLSLIQNTEGLTFGTDALLLAAYMPGGYKTGAELGGGTGIVSMLIATRGKVGEILCIEVQEEYALLAERNFEYNGLEGRIKSLHADLREVKAEDLDTVFTNPPYMKADSGYLNRSGGKRAARHEENGTIEDFCAGAARMLRWGGDFYAVYRPDRLADLIAAMRASGIEPKRMTAVHADPDATPSMILVEGKRGGRSGMKMTKPLIIYRDKAHKEYGTDMEYIMENGSFPDAFMARRAKK